MNAIWYVMGQVDGRLLLNLEETANVIGYELSTAHAKISKGEFPVPMRKQGNKWLADARDVAEYLDALRAQARELHAAMKAAVRTN